MSVVVPVGGPAPAWERCARSLQSLDPPPGEIVIVADGPASAAAAHAQALAATVIVQPERRGLAAARNRGARAASRDILLFVDADVEVPRNLAADVAALFSERPQAAAVMGSYDDVPGDPGFVSQYRNLLHHFVHQHGREQASTFWAGCGAVRRSVFESVGGFDERYVEPSIEDIELGGRLVRAGHHVHLVPSLQVKHLKRWRLLEMLSTDLWRRAVPWTQLMLRDGRAVNDLNVKVRDRVSVVLSCLALLALAPVGWPLRAAGLTALILVVVLNRRVFAFFRSRRGGLFALGTVPLYWAYLLICAAGVAIAGAGRVLRRP